MKKKQEEALRRWRLVLGPYGKPSFDASRSKSHPHPSQTEGVSKPKPQPPSLNREDQRRDRLLDFLYHREYEGRQKTADTSPSTLAIPEWLSEVRTLFPRSTVEILQKQALDRYEMTGLLADPEVLEKATPSIDLVKTLLSCRSLLPEASHAAAQKMIRKVVDEIEQKLATKIINTLQGARRRGAHARSASQNLLDWKTTIRRNLKHADPEKGIFIPERLFFFSRYQQRVPWEILILVDQSGSMTDALIHSAVTAAIFHRLRSLKTHLLLFDTEVVDVTGRIHDPAALLFGIQLGGGTDIAKAVQVAAEKIRHPRRTMLVLISDFYEFGSGGRLETIIAQLKTSGVSLMGLAALNEDAEPDFNRELAQRLTNIGMPVAVMTPDRLAQWVGEVMGG